MAWIMLLIVLGAVILAVINRKRNPRFSLLIAAIIPLIGFYYIGKYQYDSVFIFSVILYSIIVYFLIFKEKKWLAESKLFFFSCIRFTLWLLLRNPLIFSIFHFLLLNLSFSETLSRIILYSQFHPVLVFDQSYLGSCDLLSMKHAPNIIFKRKYLSSLILT